MDLTMDKDYFEQLLDAKFNHVHAEIMSLKEDTQSILQQTTKTNGRVSELEKWKAEGDGFSKGVSKFTFILLTVLGIVIGALATYYWH